MALKGAGKQIVVSGDDRLALERMLRAVSSEVRMVERARIVLCAAEGMTGDENRRSGALGIELPGWARTEASVQCFADPDVHRRGDRDPSCSVNLDHGAWHCHACGAKGGAFDAATARGYSDRAAIDLMVAYRLTEHHAYRHANAKRGPRPRSISTRPAQPPRASLRPTREDIER